MEERGHDLSRSFEYDQYSATFSNNTATFSNNVEEHCGTLCYVRLCSVMPCYMLLSVGHVWKEMFMLSVICDNTTSQYSLIFFDGLFTDCNNILLAYFYYYIILSFIESMYIELSLYF